MTPVDNFPPLPLLRLGLGNDSASRPRASPRVEVGLAVPTHDNDDDGYAYPKKTGMKVVKTLCVPASMGA